MATGVFFCHVLMILSSDLNEIARAHMRHTKDDFREAQGILCHGSGDLLADRFGLMMKKYEFHD